MAHWLRVIAQQQGPTGATARGLEVYDAIYLRQRLERAPMTGMPRLSTSLAA
jgi:hypothetical protein